MPKLTGIFPTSERKEKEGGITRGKEAALGRGAGAVLAADRSMASPDSGVPKREEAARGARGEVASREERGRFDLWECSREGAGSEERETPRGGRAPAPDETPDERAEDAGRTEAAVATVTVRADLGIFQKKERKGKGFQKERKGERMRRRPIEPTPNLMRG
jgi:hypothetical protein